MELLHNLQHCLQTLMYTMHTCALGGYLVLQEHQILYFRNNGYTRVRVRL